MKKTIPSPTQKHRVYKRITLLLTILCYGYATTTTIDFETENDGYTASATEGTGYTDIFNRTNPELGGNDTYIWAFEDLEIADPTLTLGQINVSGQTSFTFALDLLAHHYNDWDGVSSADGGDNIKIYYSLDGGSWQNLMWVLALYGVSGTEANEPAALDTDFDGEAECDHVLPSLSLGTGELGCEVTVNTFQTFTTSSISLSSNSTLDIKLDFLNFTSTDEGGYLDNIVITTSAASVVDPTSLSASVQSSSQINLTWTDNSSSDNVLLAWNSSSTFGTPIDGSTYAADASISGGGTVLQNSSTDSYSHTSLTSNTAYYYKAWSYDDSNYSSGVTTNETTLKIEPTYHPTNFSVTSSYQSISLTWTDAVAGSQAPDGYLILGEIDATITDPSDGTAVSDDTDASDNTLAKNVTHGSGASYTFSSLTASIAYYFEIFSYTNSGSNIDYKTNGTIVTGNATTGITPVFVINEIHADPDATNGDANGDGTVHYADDEFVEIINNSGSSVDIGNWVIADGVGDRYTVPSGTTIGNGEALVVFGGGTPTHINGIVGTAASGLGLNNTGDDVTLKDASGGTIVTYTYSSEGGDNQSIARDPDLSGSFVKHSTIAATGNVLFSPGKKNSSVAGFSPFNVSISGSVDHFRMLSSPIATTYADLLNELWIQGGTGGDVTSGSPNVWTYSGSFSGVTDYTANLTSGHGILVWVYKDTDFSNDNDNNLPVTLSVSGTAVSGDVSVSSISANAWALVGNPYEVTIDFDLLSKTNLTNVAYVYDHSTNSATSPDEEATGDGIYRVWNGSTGSLTNGLIEPFQGFWILANNSGGGSVTFQDADKSTSSGTFYKTMNDSTGSMSFTITSGNYSNQTFVSFMNNGELGLDNSDAYKLLPLTASERVVAISYAEGNGLDISNLPYIHEGSISIPLDIMYLTLDEDYNFVTNENEVTMNWDLSNLPETIIGLTLTNNTTNETTDLLEAEELTFTTIAKGSFPAYGSNGVNIYPEVGASHFTLTVAYSALTTNDDMMPKEFALHPAYPNPFNPSATISFDIPMVETRLITSLQIFNIKGQLVETLIRERMEPGTHTIQWNPVNLSSGLYIVQLKAGETVFNQKITYIK